MMKCPACAHENVDGTTFCEMCGEELQSTTDSATSTPSIASPDASGDIKCSACENFNPRDNLACEVCGADLHPTQSEEAPVVTSDDTAATVTANASTPVVDADVAPEAAVADTTIPPQSGAVLLPGHVKLVVEQGMNVGKQFVLGDSEILVGREDEDEEIYPDIDLSDQDEGFVHRKHATLIFENDQLFVTHLGGANRTRVNNKPIADDVPQAVKLGDKIAFGKVVLRLLPHS